MVIAEDDEEDMATVIQGGRNGFLDSDNSD